MKSYLPHLAIITSLCLVSPSCTFLGTKTPIEMIAQEIDPYIQEQIVPEITVKITGADNSGSGVIIAKHQQDSSYLILTNNHVIRSEDNITIETHDGNIHQAKPVKNGLAKDDDLALLEFSSDNSYQTASLNSAATPRIEQTILAVGYAAETGKLVTQVGIIENVPTKTLKEGYQIGYNSKILQGMSGGAILNTNGELVGINGKSAFPIVNTVYVYEDGTKPTAKEIEQLRQLSWGISLNRLLRQVNPEIMTAYGLPQPKIVPQIENRELTGWLGELEAKAKQITVRIDSSSGANGSGIIVAKEGKTYAVLTADHVICEKDRETRDCINYTYEIVTPDGKKYSLDSSSFKRQEGVDLAVVRFTSKKNYQVAQLANYPITTNDAVFVAGYPQLRQNTPAPWLFSLGYGLEREGGLLLVRDSSLATDSSDLISSQVSFSGGYELVYSSITYGGMSGGAVLDRDGRVIGVHGLAEAETALDSQSGGRTKVQLGFSLGIPINTFIGLAERFEIAATLPLQNEPPGALNPAEALALEFANLGTEIPQGNASAEIWLERGNQLWRLRRYDEAVQAFDKAIALNPEFIHLAYYGKGLALSFDALSFDAEYAEYAEYGAALASFDQATETEPNFASAFYYKSLLLYGLNRWDEALVATNREISLQQDNANLYSKKAFILSKLERYSEAEAAFNQAIEINPKLAKAYYNRGTLYAEQEKLDLAEADFNKAIEINPKFAEAYYNRGILYAQQGKLDLAEADYSKAIEINPQYALAYGNRGVIYDKQGKEDLAEADFSKAIEMNPNYANVYISRGILYAQQGKEDLAEADFNKAIEINPQNAKAYYNRGVIYDKQGKLDLAEADYSKAIEINPKLAEAYNNRGVLYKQQKKLDLALADFSKAIEINPKFAEAYFNRAELYHKQGKLDLARTNLQQAQQLFIAQGNLALAEKTTYVLKQLPP